MMKKIFMVMLVLFFAVSTAMAADLKVGDKAADFKFKDASGKAYYSMNSPRFAGKVTTYFYANAASADDNDALVNTLMAQKFDPKDYEGIGVGNLKGSSFTPNAIINAIADRKQKATGAIIIMDPDFTLVKNWGFTESGPNFILLDKNGICRYIYKGKKVPQAEFPKIISIIKGLL